MRLWIDGSAQRLLDEFWRRAGAAKDFPRDLAGPIARALPVAIVRLPQLSLVSIELWLSARGVSYTFQCSERRVRGCLVAHRGTGIIFVDGADPEEEIRFTVAHEVAHFLLDYWSVRHRVIRKLGLASAEVLDGERVATFDERLAGALAGVPLGQFTDIMDRDGVTGEPTAEVHGIEDRADRLAIALLAPPSTVLAAARPLGSTFPERRKRVIDVLIRDFGLPSHAAQRYAFSLLRAFGRGPSLVESMRL
jgi:hypothetical protein